MNNQNLINKILNAWNVNNEINQYLIGQIPTKGFQAVPSLSKGRTVGEQLAHMNRVRLGWYYFFTTGKSPKLPKVKGSNPTRAQLKKGFVDSGKKWRNSLPNRWKAKPHPGCSRKIPSAGWLTSSPTSPTTAGR